MTSEPFVSTEQLARLLGVCTKTVVRQSDRGVIPSIRVGRVLRFHVDTVLKALSRLPDRQPSSEKGDSTNAQ